MAKYEISRHNGKPALFIDGEPGPAYSYSYANSPAMAGANEIHDKFIAHGCRIFMPQVRGGVDNDWATTPYWLDHDVFPDLTQPGSPVVEHMKLIEHILSRQPDARFWVRISLDPPVRWRRRFPDDLLLNSYGKRYDGASLASDRYIDQVGKFVENLVHHGESQPWSERVIGYIIYPIGEGTTVLTCEGFLFDRSPAMQQGFRAFLRRKYGCDAALQDAWLKKTVALDTVEVPNDEEFHQRGRTHHDKVETADTLESQAPVRLHWPEPAETAAERDYCLFMRELTERNFRTIISAAKRAAPDKIVGIDAFKQTMLGWPLVARWTGDYHTHGGLMHPLSGAFGMAELLDNPELEAVATPHDYLYRGMGFGYEGEGIGDSVVARGKMMLMEEDQRTYSKHDRGKFLFDPLKNEAEARAGLWRNLGMSVSRGYNTYPMDICGPSFFMDDAIQQVLAARRVVHEAAVRWERKETPSIVMVVDDWSMLHEDFTIGYQYLSVIHQRLFGLSRCGVPFRLHLFEDLARDDFPDCHKVFLFPNLFQVDEARLKVLREKVLCNGNVAVFGPATGITDGKTLGTQMAEAVTGIPLKLWRKESPRFVSISRFDHPLTACFASRLDFGDSLAYGPLLVPQPHAEVVELGHIQWPAAKDGPGLVLREFGKGAAGNGKSGSRGAGDYASIFTCAMPLPAPLLRELARYSGTHVYGEEDDLIFADNCTITIHSVHPGKRTVFLSQPRTVWDLVERRKVGVNLDRIEVEVTPPQTNMYYLGEADPLRD